MQLFKQSDNDIQIWMTEKDKIIEKVRFSDISTFWELLLREKIGMWRTEKPNTVLT